MQMASMEALESGLLTPAQLAAAGWLMHEDEHAAEVKALRAAEGTRPLCTCAKHAAGAVEAAASPEAWADGAAVHMGRAFRAASEEESRYVPCAVAVAAARVWEASQGSEVKLEFATWGALLSDEGSRGGSRGGSGSHTWEEIQNGPSHDVDGGRGSGQAAASGQVPAEGGGAGESVSVSACSGGGKQGAVAQAWAGEGVGAAAAAASGGNEEQPQWRLQVSRSQQEVVGVLHRMGCTGMQVRLHRMGCTGMQVRLQGRNTVNKTCACTSASV